MTKETKKQFIKQQMKAKKRKKGFTKEEMKMEEMKVNNNTMNKEEGLNGAT